MISSSGSPSPRIKSAAVVTVEFSNFTGTVGGRSKAARKPRGLSRSKGHRHEETPAYPYASPEGLQESLIVLLSL
jgi:hypothetical protein